MSLKSAAGRYVKKLRMGSHHLWNSKKPLLYWLEIELTERCNNKCLHCGINLPEDDAEAIRRELSTAKLKTILCEAAELGCMVVKFTGGEPMLREDFAELYVFARKLGLRVIILTNATFVTPQLADLFRRIPPLEKIEVSLYGMKRKTYESVSRIPGSYAKARKGIQLLLKNKIPLVMKQIQLFSLHDETREFASWPEPFCEAEKFTPMTGPLILRCRRDSEQKNRIIKRLRPTPEQFLSVISEKAGEYVEGMKSFIPQYSGKKGDKIISCGAGKGLACLDAYGNLQSCLLLRHPETIYDLRSGSLRHALTDFFPGLREKRSENPDFLHRCANCTLGGLCEQCPAHSWIEHGALDTPVEYYCEIAQVQARFLGLLRKGEKPWEVENWEERVRRFSEAGSSRVGKRKFPRGS